MAVVPVLLIPTSTPTPTGVQLVTPRRTHYLARPHAVLAKRHTLSTATELVVLMSPMVVMRATISIQLVAPVFVVL